MSVALRGNLRDFSIADVFQLIGQQRKTGVLEIAHGAEKVRLLFEKGAVVRAAPATGSEDSIFAEMLVRCGVLGRDKLRGFEREAKDSLQRLGTLLERDEVVSREELHEIEDLLTRNTLFRLLSWSEGSFDFAAQSVEHDRDPSRLLPAEQILMDGLRMVDEWRTFAGEVPSEETVFQRTGRFEFYQASVQGEPRRRLAQAQKAFLLIDGRLTARRVIDLARLDTFDGMRVLADLRLGGLIEPLAPSQLARRPRRGADLSATSSVGWIAGLLPLLLLAALAAFAQRPLPPSVHGGVFPIRRAVIEEARGAFEVERLRNALEAYRFAKGRWPERLQELRGAGLLPPSALASLGERPYYYERRGEDAVLLAPEY